MVPEHLRAARAAIEEEITKLGTHRFDIDDKIQAHKVAIEALEANERKR